MFERIKKIYSKWRLRRRIENQSQLSDRGRYVLKYMINKYINEIQFDFFQLNWSKFFI